MNYKDMNSKYVGVASARSALEALKPIMTSKRLLDQGICLCDDCGNMCSIDYKWCWKCNKPVVIFEKPKTRQEYVNEKKLKDKKNEKEKTKKQD